MAVLTKAEILKGINKITKEEIKSLNTELWLRPLSSAELDELNYIEAEGMGNIEQNTVAKGRNLGNSKQSTKMNVLKLTKATDKAKYEKIRLSLDNDKNSDDPWTTEEIMGLSREAINELIEVIDNISGVEVTEVDVKNFPEN